MNVTKDDKILLEALDYEFQRIGRSDLSKFCFKLSIPHLNQVSFEKLKNHCDQTKTDLDAYALLSLCYENGIGVIRDNVKSHEIQELGLKSEHPILLAFLAQRYLNGNIVKKDVKLALELFEKSMTQNKYYFPISLFANRCLFSRYIKQDIKKGLELLELASNKGYPFATYMIIQYYDNKDIDPNYEKILYYIDKLNEQLTYSSPIGICRGAIYFLKGRMHFYGKHFPLNTLEGLKLLNLSNEFNNVDAKVVLADCNLTGIFLAGRYLAGYRVMANITKALELYFESLIQIPSLWNEFIEALNNLRKDLIWNQVARELTNNFEKLKSESTMKDPIILFNLAKCYKHGIGTKESSKEAAVYFKESAILGNVSAMFELGNCYKKGMGVAVAPSKAVFWYKEASQTDEDYLEETLDTIEAFDSLHQNLNGCFSEMAIQLSQSLSAIIADYSFDESIRQIRVTNLETESSNINHPNPKKALTIDKLTEQTKLLCTAAKKGNLLGMKNILDSGLNPDSVFVDGFTAMHYACSAGNLEAVMLLEKYKGDIYAVNGKGRTALSYFSDDELKKYKEMKKATKDKQQIRI